MKAVKLRHIMHYYLTASSVTNCLSAGPGGIQDWAHDNTRAGPQACSDPTSQREEEASSRYHTHWSFSHTFLLASAQIHRQLLSILLWITYLKKLQVNEIISYVNTKCWHSNVSLNWVVVCCWCMLCPQFRPLCSSWVGCPNFCGTKYKDFILTLK